MPAHLQLQLVGRDFSLDVTGGIKVQEFEYRARHAVAGLIAVRCA